MSRTSTEDQCRNHLQSDLARLRWLLSCVFDLQEGPSARRAGAAQGWKWSILSTSPRVFSETVSFPLNAGTRYWIGVSSAGTVNWFFSFDTTGPGVGGNFFAVQSSVSLDARESPPSWPLPPETWREASGFSASLLSFTSFARPSTLNPQDASRCTPTPRSKRLRLSERRTARRRTASRARPHVGQPAKHFSLRHDPEHD